MKVIAYQTDWRVCVCVWKRVCGCVTARKSAVKLVTTGWKRYVWICDVDTRLVDLVRVAAWKVDLGSKKVPLTYVYIMIVQPSNSRVNSVRVFYCCWCFPISSMPQLPSFSCACLSSWKGCSQLLHKLVERRVDFNREVTLGQVANADHLCQSNARHTVSSATLNMPFSQATSALVRSC